MKIKALTFYKVAVAIFGLLVLATGALAEDDWLKQSVNEANQQTREKYQRISTVLSLYQQLRDIELDLPIDVISDVPVDWQPSAQATLEMADKEYKVLVLRQNCWRIVYGMSERF